MIHIISGFNLFLSFILLFPELQLIKFHIKFFLFFHESINLPEHYFFSKANILSVLVLRDGRNKQFEIKSRVIPDYVVVLINIFLVHFADCFWELGNIPENWIPDSFLMCLFHKNNILITFISINTSNPKYSVQVYPANIAKLYKYLL